MKDLEVKKGILQEIMDMMDSHESEGLKKHPKFLAAKVEVVKPESEEASFPSEEKSEEAPKSESMSKDDLDPEDLERLMELHRSLKD